MNVAHLLSERAKSHANAVAILDLSLGGKPRRLTFGELESSASAQVLNLRSAGLVPGDCVLVLLPMSVELYVFLCAIFRAGLSAMFLDPSAGLDHIESCCAMQLPKAFIGSPKAHLLRLLSPALRRVPIKILCGNSLFSKSARSTTAKSERIFDCPNDTPALVRFSSGSTGVPKRSIRTHGFLLQQQQALERALNLAPGLMDLVTLPMFVLANLASGASSIIPRANLRSPRKVNPGPVIDQIEEFRPHRVSASPAFIERLADFCAASSKTLDCLQAIYTGGAPVFLHAMDKFQRLSPKADILAIYGSTEAEPMARLHRKEISPADRDAMNRGRGLLAGTPDSAIQLRILRENALDDPKPLTQGEFERACQIAGEPGEIVVSGPHVHTAESPETGATDTNLQVEGKSWHRTGDAGYLDCQGRLWLLGRSSARIRDDIGTVYPFQVECAAYADNSVGRAALVENRGKRVLIVEPRNGIEPAALRERLAWSGLERVKIVRRIPLDKRHNAKVDYTALKRLL